VVAKGEVDARGGHPAVPREGVQDLAEMRAGEQQQLTCLQSGFPASAAVAGAPAEAARRPEAEGGDCDDDGFCWFGYGYRLPGEDEKDSYAMWMLMPPEESRYGEVWVRASAIPLPQAGEVEA